MTEFGKIITSESAKYLGQLRVLMRDNSNAGKLSMWTVYDHPSDFPKDFVARLHVADTAGSRPTGQLLSSPDLETLRYVLCFELGLTCLARDPTDDKKILEVWL